MHILCTNFHLHECECAHLAVFSFSAFCNVLIKIEKIFCSEQRALNWNVNPFMSSGWHHYDFVIAAKLGRRNSRAVKIWLSTLLLNGCGELEEFARKKAIKMFDFESPSSSETVRPRYDKQLCGCELITFYLSKAIKQSESFGDKKRHFHWQIES